MGGGLVPFDKLRTRLLVDEEGDWAGGNAKRTHGEVSLQETKKPCLLLGLLDSYFTVKPLFNQEPKDSA